MNLPVGPCLAEFRLQGHDLVNRHHRIVVSMQYQDPGRDLHVAGVSRGAKQAVKTDDGAQVRAASGEIENAHSTETEPDCRHPRRIDLGQCTTCRQCSADTCLQQRPVLDEWLHQCRILAGVSATPALAVHIERETDIAQFGQSPRLSILKVTLATPGVRNHHTRQRTAGIAIPGDHAFQYDISVVVLQPSGFNLHNSGPRIVIHSSPSRLSFRDTPRTPELPTRARYPTVCSRRTVLRYRLRYR